MPNGRNPKSYLTIILLSCYLEAVRLAHVSIPPMMSQPTPPSDLHRNNYIAAVVNLIISAVTAYAQGLYDKQAYHTSILSGYAWVLELLAGHPERIRCELGVHLHVFEQLVDSLRKLGYSDSRNVTLEEQLAIFLHASVTGLSIQHLGERFQRSNGTIST